MNTEKQVSKIGERRDRVDVTDPLGLDLLRNRRDGLRDVWETGQRGVELYAEFLCGESEEDFLKMIEGKKVLDLGSGPARLATEIAIKKRLDPSFVPPERVVSLNRRFADGSYRRMWYDRLGRDLIKEHGKEKWGNIKKALQDDVIPNCTPLDWNNLDELLGKEGEGTFDFILSQFAFPFYFDREDTVELKYFDDVPNPLGLTLAATKSKKVLENIAKLLSVGGVAYLHTEYSAFFWKGMTESSSGKFKADVEKFFLDFGLKLDIRYTGEDGNTVLVLTKL